MTLPGYTSSRAYTIFLQYELVFIFQDAYINFPHLIDTLCINQPQHRYLFPLLAVGEMLSKLLKNSAV